MDRFLVDDREYKNMLLRYSDKPFFTAVLMASRDCFKRHMKDVFILMNRYYSSFTIVDGDIQKKWEDVILNNDLEIGDELEFNTPIYYDINGEIKRSCIDQNGITFYFEINHSNEEVLVLFFRANNYTDKNYVEYYSAEMGWQKKIVDQSLATKVNRDNLTGFLT